MSTDRNQGESLPLRLASHLGELGRIQAGDRLVVAVSGGLDSLVLLHLLRFFPVAPGTELIAAHMDHGMRAGSSGDALWLRGLAGAWGVELEVGRPEERPSGQEEARVARYAFLERVRRERGARWILTAHHRDDQAETVLHRVLRGTGPTGLRGIPAAGPLPAGARSPGPGEGGGVLRPLLPFWREELEDHARKSRLRPRRDPTNVSPRYARNVVRRELLPRAEEAVAPGARAALVRLSELAREEEEAWEAVLARVEEGMVVERSEEAVVLDRERFVAEPPALQRRLLRRWLASFGVHPTRSATADAQAFGAAAPSGRRMDLAGGLRLGRDYGRLWLGRDPGSGPRGLPGGAKVPQEEATDLAEATGPEPGADPEPGTALEPETASLPIPSRGSGAGTVRVGGRTYRVRWGPPAGNGGDAGERSPEEAPGERPWTLRLAASSLRFPLRVRGWRPGDRVRLRGGGKRLAKALGERRVPRAERRRLPVVVDADEGVVWIPGVLRGSLPGVVAEGEGGGDLRITVSPEGEESE